MLGYPQYSIYHNPMISCETTIKMGLPRRQSIPSCHARGPDPGSRWPLLLGLGERWTTGSTNIGDKSGSDSRRTVDSTSLERFFVNFVGILTIAALSNDYDCASIVFLLKENDLRKTVKVYSPQQSNLAKIHHFFQGCSFQEPIHV